MRQFEAKVLKNTPIAPNLMHLAFEWPQDLLAPTPGQFFTVLPPTVEIGAGTLLRRPLAFAAFVPGAIKTASEGVRAAHAHEGIHEASNRGDAPFGSVGASAHSIYQVRGPGTRALAALRLGTSMSIIGPLGNSFPEPADGQTAVIAGGGIGIGPMLFLASWLRAKSLPYRFVAGFRSATMVPLRASARTVDRAMVTDIAAIWNQLLAGAIIATDDGSLGTRGTVLDALAHLDLTAPASERWHLYGCGPGPMLAALARFAPARRAAAHFSAEQWMACGVGACYGCVLPAAAGGYLRVCADGPVFRAEDIDWEASAR